MRHFFIDFSKMCPVIAIEGTAFSVAVSSKTQARFIDDIPEPRTYLDIEHLLTANQTRTITRFLLQEKPEMQVYYSSSTPLTKPHKGDKGIDLPTPEGFTLSPGQRRLVHTGIRVALPANTVGAICPRSGLALDWGVTVLNSPGIIDQGYRGDIGVILINHGDQAVCFAPGDRIAQLVLLNTEDSFALEKVEWLEPSQDGRGEKGFGSSGLGELGFSVEGDTGW